MVEKPRCNASLLGLHNVQFIHAQIEQMPLPDASVDVVIPLRERHLWKDELSLGEVVVGWDGGSAGAVPRRSPLFTATSASGQTRLWLPPRPDRPVPAAFGA
jgi:hypothetical protein